MMVIGHPHQQLCGIAVLRADRVEWPRIGRLFCLYSPPQQLCGIAVLRADRVEWSRIGRLFCLYSLLPSYCCRSLGYIKSRLRAKIFNVMD
jgi:hypothetical protein